MTDVLRQIRVKSAEAMNERGRNGLQEKVNQLIQGQARRNLDRGILYYHTHDSRHSPKGFPDVMVLFGNSTRWLVAELKNQKARPAPEQVAWLDAFARVGADVYLWRPIHWLDGEIVRIIYQQPGEVTCAWVPGAGVPGDPFSLPTSRTRRRA